MEILHSYGPQSCTEIAAPGTAASSGSPGQPLPERESGRTVKPITAIDDPRYVKAMSHPVRVRIMAMLQERKASPNELSQWLGTTLGATAYHVRTLHKLGLIELVDETRVRGAVEHHYKAKARPKASQENWSKASPVAKQAAVGS